MVRIEAIEARAYRIPTDAPEGDGTLRWDSTTMVVVEVRAGGKTGLGWTYGSRAAATVVHELAEIVVGRDAMEVGAVGRAMIARLRNAGPSGIGATAVSAVNVALWDLEAKLLDQPLASLLAPMRDRIPVYGSGGFVTYTDEQLCTQLAGWIAEGITAVKMKVGAEPERDPERMRKARSAIGPGATLMIDANGAFDSSRALAFAHAAVENGVAWFEEPVPQSDRAGMRRVHEGAPAGMDIAAGEYLWAPAEARDLVEAVDVLQADVTRCGGITGFLEVAAIAEASRLPLSAHTAPTLHVGVACAAPTMLHVEWFHDHVRIEQMLFEGAPRPVGGGLAPDRERPGLGVTFRRSDAERFAL